MNKHVWVEISKEREIVHELTSQTKQTWLVEDKFIAS